MDFYNKHFYRIIRLVDPDGMLNLPLNVYTNEKCLDRYFRNDKDFHIVDVPWMCDQLILLLANFDEVVAITSAIPFLQNDFQRYKYPFVLITQAFLGLILIQKNSTKAYISYYTMSTMALHKKKMSLDKVPRKKKRKKTVANNQLHNKEVIPNQQIVILSNQDQVIPDFKTNHHEVDVLLNHPRHTENAIEFNLPEIIAPNHAVSNIPISQDQNIISNLNSEENIGIINRRSYPEQLQFIPLPSIEEFVISNILQGQVIEQPKDTSHLLELPNQMTTGEHNSLTNLHLKRKRSSHVIKRNLKKKPIEQSSKVLKNRLKKLEGELPDRPLECMAIKYLQQTLSHLPLRYATYHNSLNISFSVLTLNMELEKYKNQDDVFNNEITMSSYKAITEKFNYSNVSNSCIYQQCINNSLPHLSLLPLAEEYLTNNSLVWRDTINEINKKLEDSLKDISPTSQLDPSKWKEFKETVKQRVSQCLVAHKTLIGPELSHIDISQPLMKFPSPHQIDQLLNDKTVSEHQNLNEMPQIHDENIFHVPPNEGILPPLLPLEKSPCNQVQISTNQENSVMDQFEQNIQDNVKSNEVHNKQSIDILQIISNTLQRFPSKKSCLMFTDLCPIHVTNRKYAISVLVELLGIHKKGIVKLNQPCNNTEPSTISIEPNIENFF